MWLWLWWSQAGRGPMVVVVVVVVVVIVRARAHAHVPPLPACGGAWRGWTSCRCVDGLVGMCRSGGASDRVVSSYEAEK